MDVTTEHTMSPTIGAIAGAIAKAQSEMTAAAKDSNNPHFKSRYADLASVIDACRPQLSKHGVAIIQLPGVAQSGVVSCTTILAHGESGEYFRCIAGLSMGKSDAHGYGSAITYLRRYTLQAMAGVAADDDDGNAAASATPAATNAAPLVSEDQVVMLISLCEAIGGDVAQRICKAYNVKTLSQLPAATFDKVKARLEDQLAEKAAAQTNADAAQAEAA